MLPVGALMIEHRLIERMISLVDGQARRIKAKGIPDQQFLGRAVDFLRNYADRCHHGKEEGILFRQLKEKPLSPDHQRILRELVDEHAQARAIVEGLDDARVKFCGGDYAVVLSLTERLGALAELYPRHIEKEDKHFFLPSMEYFTAEEKAAMLREFDEFDKTLFIDQYRMVIEGQEAMAR